MSAHLLDPPPTELPIDMARPLMDELVNARQICTDAKALMGALLDQARHGQPLNMSGVAPLVRRIVDSVARHGVALISVARLKTTHDYRRTHGLAVSAMMVALARKLRLDEAEVRAAGAAGLLHDIGLALVPAAILDKPGALSSTEFAAVRRHCALGHELLTKTSGVGPMTLDVGLHHHEKADGSGYPHGLHGAEISLYAKMAAVCDVYDALTSDRVYQSAQDPADALRQMEQWTSSHLDPSVFYAFVRTVGLYPIGSLLRLRSGRIGVVVDQTATAPDLPLVQAFFCERSNQRIPPELVNLGAIDCQDHILDRDALAGRKFP